MSDENDNENENKDDDKVVNMTAMCKVEECECGTFLLTVTLSGIPLANDAKLIGEALYKMLESVMNALYPKHVVIDERKHESSSDDGTVH